MKKRRYRNIWFLPLLILPLLTGCTQPNGYIGNWFGSWYLETIFINGETDPDYGTKVSPATGTIMVSFQGKVFNMAYIDGREIYGIWDYAGMTLRLDASYETGSGAEVDYFTPFPVAMRFPKGESIVEVTVTKIENKVMQWQYIDPEGDLITYNFRKYP